MAEIKDFKRNQNLLKGKMSKEGILPSGTQKNDTGRQADDKNQKSMDSRIARYRHLKFYTVFIIFVVLAVLIAGLYISWKRKLYIDYEVLQQTEWTKSSDSKCMNLAGTLFTYSNDGMSCTDAKGKVIWNQTYEMQNPMIRTCKKTVAVGDYNGRSIYISNTQENLGVVETTMPIRDFSVSENGIVAAVLDDSTVTAIYLYSSAGDLLVSFTTTMSKSGYPIAIDISDDGTLVAVSYVKAENGALSSNIGFYNFAAVGQNYTDNLVGGYGYAGAVVPLVQFMNDDTVFAVADNRLMFFKGKQKPENILDTLISEEIQSIFYDENHVGLVFFNSTGETTYRMEIYDTNAKKTGEIAFNTNYTDIVFDTASIIIRNDNECVIYDWDNRLKFEGSFTERILCFLPMGSISRYTVVTDKEIQIIELQ